MLESRTLAPGRVGRGGEPARAARRATAKDWGSPVIVERSASPISAVRAARVTESICRLPAVATLDWCDAAAEAVVKAVEPAAALVFIGRVDDNGRVIDCEATGAAGTQNAEVTTVLEGSRSTDRRAVAIPPRDARLEGLRAALRPGSWIGWRPGELDPGEHRVAIFDTSTGDASWDAGSLGERWGPLNPSAIVLCAIGFAGPMHSRVILAELAVLEGSDVSADDAASTLGAVSGPLLRQAAVAIGYDSADSHRWLTEREQLILWHLMQGKSVRKIAEDIDRSTHTVHDHVKSLHRKLRASSRGELVARALGHLRPPAVHDAPVQHKPEVVVPIRTAAGV